MGSSRQEYGSGLPFPSPAYPTGCPRLWILSLQPSGNVTASSVCMVSLCSALLQTCGCLEEDPSAERLSAGLPSRTAACHVSPLSVFSNVSSCCFRHFIITFDKRIILIFNFCINWKQRLPSFLLKNIQGELLLFTIVSSVMSASNSF